MEDPIVVTNSTTNNLASAMEVDESSVPIVPSIDTKQIETATNDDEGASNDVRMEDEESSSAAAGPKEVRLTSEQLNNLIMLKVAGALACNGDMEIIRLKDKLLEMGQSKYKINQKLITLHKHLEEVSKAVVDNSEQMARANAESSAAPLKFFRSVGLQVNSESKAQLSVQNSSVVRTRENTVPFNPNGVLVGPASVKRNFASKMSENTDVVPNKKHSPGGNTENDVEMQSVPSRRSGGNTPTRQVINTADGRTVVIQQNQGATPGGNVATRPAASGPQAPGQRPRSGTPRTAANAVRHPVASPARSRFNLPPLPPPSNNNALQQQNTAQLPPRPVLTLKTQPDGIVLSWQHPPGSNNTEVVNYQIFACQESLNSATPPAQWKRVGDVKALPLPMACTLSQFTEENRYHFIVRGVDAHNRTGQFCESVSIVKRRSHTTG